MSDALTSNCPKCGSPVGSAVDQCPQCGIFFAKWQERENNVASGNMERYTIANATSSEFNWTILAIVAVIIVAIFYFIDHSQ